MKSLKARFYQMSKKDPNMGSYIWFVDATRNQKFSEKTIGFWFAKLMDKDEYLKKEKKGLISYLYEVSNDSEEGKKWDKNPIGRLLIRGIEDISIVKIRSPINA